MEGESLDLGRVKRLWAWARGTPGKRTFYLTAGDERTWVRMWMEKESLKALADSIDRMLYMLEERAAGTVRHVERKVAESAEPSGEPAAEFKLGQLGLGYEEMEGLVVLLAHEAESDFQGPPTVQLQATPAQMWAVSRQIDELCAAGRPICPLCHGPVDPEGHVCVRRNGHQEWREG